MTSLGRCAGDPPRRTCSAPAVLMRQGRPQCAPCDAAHKGDRNRRVGERRRGQRDLAHRQGEPCDLARRGRPCDVCDARAATPRPACRPRVVAGEETTELRVRVGESHLRALDELVREGYARDRSAATRRAIEEAHHHGR